MTNLKIRNTWLSDLNLRKADPFLKHGVSCLREITVSLLKRSDMGEEVRIESWPINRVM